MSQIPPSTIYLGTEQVLARYNRKDPSWIFRQVKRGTLPPPDFYLAGRKYWSLASIEANEEKAREAPPPTFNEPPPIVAKRRKAAVEPRSAA